MNTLAIYDQIIDTLAHIERKGKTTPYTSLNGHMFTFISKEKEICIRLSAQDREAFLQDFPDSEVVQHGRVMKEYVSVPKSYLEDVTKTTDLIEASYRYVSGLKPKPTKRKK